MTVIRPNSISGVTSITAQVSDITIFGASSGFANITAGNISAAGTITYEDVTNIDSVGVVTARTGIKIGPSAGVAGTFFADGSYVTAGIITATTFHGSGANLTGIDATKIITGNTQVQTIDTGSDGHIKFTTEGTEKVRIITGGHVSIGYAGDVATSNGGIGRKFGLRSTANNFIVGETTQTTAHYGIYIEARQTGRSGGARIAQFGLRNDDSGNGVISFQTAPNGADVTERVIIDSAGHLRPVANATYDLGVSGAAWRNLYVNDAHFSNEGGSNSVDGTWGSWTLQEGENNIFMINNRTGKKYAITMKEVE